MTFAPPIPSKEFLDFNDGLVDVTVDGFIRLTPEGWRAYGPLFARFSEVLQDRMPFELFRSRVADMTRRELLTSGFDRPVTLPLPAALHQKHYGPAPVSASAGQVIPFPVRNSRGGAR